ncbi:MAG: YihY/virulence factor BrkB family protein [Oscillochloridaceae bacterium]|nr:YihY/virulence factor BrkB family protein [Chloroflexaceae bacterium]MDW8391916.1 YihY/virulence factor BrkB family protein [Oscillochloridaceae bacterium]
MHNHPLVRLIRLTVEKYQSDRVGDMAAALAYFAIFSIFPMLLVVISIVGFVVDPQQLNVQTMLLQLVGSAEIAGLISQTLTHFSETRVGTGLLGVVTLLFAATGLLGALHRALQQIWNVQPGANGGGLKTAVTTMVMGRLTLFALLLGIAALILAAVLGNLAISLLMAYTDWLPLNRLLVQVVQIALFIALLTAGFATLYKVLASPLPRWGDVWPAALVAAIAFTVLQRLAEFIFARVNFSSFGVLGAAMTLLLWVFISSQILLFGGELSYAWSRVFGSQREGKPAAAQA